MRASSSSSTTSSEAYQWADLVVARAGALTVSELAMVGVGAVLVPFAAAIDDHQTLNARHFAKGGAALVIPERSSTPEGLARSLTACLRRSRRSRQDGRGRARASEACRGRSGLAAACVAAAEVRA